MVKMITLETKNLLLTTANQDDLPAIYEFEIRNKKHLERWESICLESDETLKEEIKKRLKIWLSEFEEKKSIRFCIRQKIHSEKIIGFCNYTQIFYGPFQACYLGYKIDYEFEGKGLMFEALTSSIAYIFESLNLHRIMANYMPVNTRSANLLHRLGFEIEGLAKNYLLINNKWEDHVLTALIKENWQQNPT